jgi:hypothetical protein
MAREIDLDDLYQELECERHEREHAGDTAFGLFSLSSNGIAAQQPTRDWDVELCPF